PTAPRSSALEPGQGGDTGPPLACGAMKRSAASPAPCHRSRWAGALVLMALVAQWLLLVASTSHHAQMAAAPGPWAQLCRSVVGVAPAGDPVSGASEKPGGVASCPVCAAVALSAPPPVALGVPQATAPVALAAVRSHGAVV